MATKIIIGSQLIIWGLLTYRLWQLRSTMPYDIAGVTWICNCLVIGILTGVVSAVILAFIWIW